MRILYSVIGVYLLMPIVALAVRTGIYSSSPKDVGFTISRRETPPLPDTFQALLSSIWSILTLTVLNSISGKTGVYVISVSFIQKMHFSQSAKTIYLFSST